MTRPDDRQRNLGLLGKDGAIVLDAPEGSAPFAVGETVHLSKSLDRDIDGRMLLMFRPITFAFDDATAWQILDFKIGHLSQFARADGVRADDFLSILRPGDRDILQIGMYYEMIVRPQREGLRFRCVMRGAALYH